MLVRLLHSLRSGRIRFATPSNQFGLVVVVTASLVAASRVAAFSLKNPSPQLYRDFFADIKGGGWMGGCARMADLNSAHLSGRLGVRAPQPPPPHPISWYTWVRVVVVQACLVTSPWELRLLLKSDSAGSILNSVRVLKQSWFAGIHPPGRPLNQCGGLRLARKRRERKSFQATLSG
ncbi:hypothetical protein LY76DRAFT_34306 [Colletotrichum caudatum]|nr:hypothetical protein LY76DRAFT_34306 [Colletotrichum caudatum]